MKPLSTRRAVGFLAFWAFECTKHTPRAILCGMKHYTWNPEKNNFLKKERGVSFEDAVFHSEAGNEAGILEHPNKARLAQQAGQGLAARRRIWRLVFVKAEWLRFRPMERPAFYRGRRATITSHHPVHHRKVGVWHFPAIWVRCRNAIATARCLRQTLSP